MKKCCLFITMSMFVSMVSFSQTIKENIEKLSKDPKTAENAGKADVYISGNKKVICDTSTKQVSNSEALSETSRKKKQRRKL